MPRWSRSEGLVEDLAADPATIESEIKFLSSPAFIRRMVDKLDLAQDPEFAPWLIEQEPSWFDQMVELLNPLRYVPEAWWAALESESAGPATDPAARRMNRVIGNVARTADGRPGRPLLRDLPDVPVRGSGQGRPHRQWHGR